MNGGQEKSRIAGDRGRRILEYPDIIDIPVVTEYVDEFAARYGCGAMSVLSAGKREGMTVPAVILGSGKPALTYTAADRTGAAVLLRYINEFCEFLKVNRRIYGYSMSHRAANRAVAVIPSGTDGGDDRHNKTEPIEPCIMFSRLEKEGQGEVYASARTSLCRMICSITGYSYSVGNGTEYNRPGGVYSVKIGGSRDDFSEYSAVREFLFTMPYLV